MLLLSSRTKPRSKSSGQVRIIGGSFRGRKLGVVDVDGLRPTGDRQRETLFNWLQARIAGSRCLDLFAGSGALGIEAVSRGAASVILIEKDVKAAAALAEVVASWPHAGRLVLERGTAESFLAKPAGAPFDIVFIDPPFAHHLQRPMLEALADGHLRDGAMVYVEGPTGEVIDGQLPRGFSMVKEQRYGDVSAWLLEFLSVSRN